MKKSDYYENWLWLGIGLGLIVGFAIGLALGLSGFGIY